MKKGSKSSIKLASKEYHLIAKLWQIIRSNTRLLFLYYTPVSDITLYCLSLHIFFLYIFNMQSKNIEYFYLLLLVIPPLFFPQDVQCDVLRWHCQAGDTEVLLHSGGCSSHQVTYCQHLGRNSTEYFSVSLTNHTDVWSSVPPNHYIFKCPPDSPVFKGYLYSLLLCKVLLECLCIHINCYIPGQWGHPSLYGPVIGWKCWGPSPAFLVEVSSFYIRVPGGL